MSTIKSTVVVPIAFYCFFGGAYFLFLAFNSFWGNKASSFDLWFGGPIFVGLACMAVAVGIGILNLNKLCWRVLFFSLATSVSSAISLIIIFFVFLSTRMIVLTPYYKIIQSTYGGWVAFLSFSLFGVFVLVNLISDDFIACFGELGPLISPF